MIELLIALAIWSVWMLTGMACLAITEIKLKQANLFKSLVCVIFWPAWLLYCVNKG